MNRRLIALGVASPLVLAAVCAAALLLMGIAAWLLTSQDEQSKIIRIIPLAPLTTPKAVGSSTANQATDQPIEPPPIVEAAPELETQPENRPAMGAQPEDQSDVTLTPEDIEEALGFALPPGSVNSITQEGVATRLVIPKLNLDASVAISPVENQTWKVDHLGQSVGHLEGTAAPGSSSNIVLAGHVTLSAGVYGPFAGLAQLSAGDVVFVYSGEQRFQYVVDGYQMVDRTAVEVTYPSEIGQVTLITCNNWDPEAGRYQERVVVKGHLVEG